MVSVQKFIFPGIALGCLFLVFVTSLIASPSVALAQNAVPAANPTAASGQKNTTGQSAMGQVFGVLSASPNQKPIAGQANANNPSEAQNGACALNQNYPQAVLQWCTLITQYAAKHNLDPNLVAAVMLQESGGNPKAYSKSGAVGLMQVMPNDGLASSFMCINGPCFSSRPSTEQLYDPEFNIAYGTQMLAELIQKYGDIREALHAYGPINIGYQYADIIIGIMNRFQ